MDKKYPIIFSIDMVRAILEGRKTQTRRAIKKQDRFKLTNLTDKWMNPCKPKDHFIFDRANGLPRVAIKCPYGRVGDKLWVRETWSVSDGTLDQYFIYKANGRPHPDIVDSAGHRSNGHWRPSIHMPHGASRITLEITDVRVERLRDMTTEDAIAEGMTPKLAVELLAGKDYLPYCIMVGGMKLLWNSLHKKQYRWEDNPWVWVISFKKEK